MKRHHYVGAGSRCGLVRPLLKPTVVDRVTDLTDFAHATQRAVRAVGALRAVRCTAAVAAIRGRFGRCVVACCATRKKTRREKYRVRDKESQVEKDGLERKNMQMT